MSQPLRLDLLFFDAGGGHRAAAHALKSVMEAQPGNDNYTIELVNLQEELDSLDIFRKITGIRLQDLYNLMLAKGWTLGSTNVLRMIHGIIRLYHRQQVKLLTSLWEKRQPDLVISLVPNFNRAIFQSLRVACPETQMVTVLTDFADFPPHFWIERQDQYLVCGTDRAVEQAEAMGYTPDRIFRASGMILRPSFYSLPVIDRAEALRDLHLDPDIPCALLLFGAQGSPKMLEIARRLGNAKQDLQLIAVCGKNVALRHEMEALATRNRIHVEGFTERVPYFMALSDFFIGKPGPGSIAEAIHMNLPVIVECNSWTLPQERYNAEWLEENQVGIALKSFAEIEEVVVELFEDGLLHEMKYNASRIKNRAVFEVASIVRSLAGVPTAMI